MALKLCTLNFKFIDNIAIEANGVYLDLHSNFDFIDFNYDANEKSLTMEWKKSVGNWVSKDLSMQGFILTFADVQYFAEYKTKNETDIDFIGCLHPEDRLIMDGFLPITAFKSGFDLIFGFISGGAIKVSCGSIACSFN